MKKMFGRKLDHWRIIMLLVAIILACGYLAYALWHFMKATKDDDQDDDDQDDDDQDDDDQDQQEKDPKPKQDEQPKSDDDNTRQFEARTATA